MVRTCRAHHMRCHWRLAHLWVREINGGRLKLRNFFSFDGHPAFALWNLRLRAQRVCLLVPLESAGCPTKSPGARCFRAQAPFHAPGCPYKTYPRPNWVPIAAGERMPLQVGIVRPSAVTRRHQPRYSASLVKERSGRAPPRCSSPCRIWNRRRTHDNRH